MAPQILFKGKTLIEIPKFNLVYSLPDLPDKKTTDWYFEDFGEGFHMASFSELIPLFYILSNYQSDEIKGRSNSQFFVSIIKKLFPEKSNDFSQDSFLKLKETLENKILVASTGVIYSDDGIYIKDNPSVLNSTLNMNSYSLSKAIEYYEDIGYSSSGSIRFIADIGFDKQFIKRTKTLNQLILALSNNHETYSLFSNLYVNRGLEINIPLQKSETPLFVYFCLSNESKFVVDISKSYPLKDVYAIGVKEIK